MSVEMPCVYFSDGKCAKFSEPGYVLYCGYSPCGFDVPSNADRIRGMSDKELTEFLWNRDIQIVERASKAVGFNYHYDEAQCRQNISDWLKSPGG